jgi:autophagy-related protein 2
VYHSESKAIPFLSMGSVSASEPVASPTGATEARTATIHVRTGTLPTQPSKSRLTAPPSSTTAVEISVPSFSASLAKDTLDGLQLWADDMAQWADRAFSGKGSSEGSMVTNSQTTSRGQSTIIGSRYFVQRTASNVGDEEEIHRSDLVIRMGIDDGMYCFDRSLAILITL